MFERQLRAAQELLVRDPNNIRAQHELMRIVERSGYAASREMASTISFVSDMALENKHAEKCLEMTEQMANNGINDIETMRAVWKLADRVGRLPKINKDAYLASDPSVLPIISVLDRVTITRADGSLVERREGTGDGGFQRPSAEGGWRYSGCKWSSADEAAYVMEFMDFLEEIHKREPKAKCYVRYYNPRNFWVNYRPYVREYSEWVSDNRRTWFDHRNHLIRMNSLRFGSWWGKANEMGHYEIYYEDNNDMIPDSFRARSELSIYTVGSSPMFHNMNDEDYVLMKEWADAQEK